MTQRALDIQRNNLQIVNNRVSRGCTYNIEKMQLIKFISGAIDEDHNQLKYQR